MTTTLAITGKSGTGKTTVVKAFMRIFKEYFPDKTILLFDNDLSRELGFSFGLDIKNTIYGIRSGKHEYKTGIPAHMSKQEYVEWALEDIIVNIDENVDLITSWITGSKDCQCPVTSIVREALKKLFARYDFVIFDCEFDLKYLSQLVDIPINETVILATLDEESVHIAKCIMESSKKYSLEGQSGVILNRVEKGVNKEISSLLNGWELNILGVLPKDKDLKTNPVARESKILQETIKEFYPRLNLPQKGG